MYHMLCSACPLFILIFISPIYKQMIRICIYRQHWETGKKATIPARPGSHTGKLSSDRVWLQLPPIKINCVASWHCVNPSLQLYITHSVTKTSHSKFPLFWPFYVHRAPLFLSAHSMYKYSRRRMYTCCGIVQSLEQLWCTGVLLPFCSHCRHHSALHDIQCCATSVCVCVCVWPSLARV